MVYFLLGLSMGTFVSGLIITLFNKSSSLIPARYLYGLSGLLVFVAVLLMAWG